MDINKNIFNVGTEEYFLSNSNPMATIDQRDLEKLAISILNFPEVQRAKKQAATRWKTIVGQDIPNEAKLSFNQFMDDWAYNYVLKAVNSDPNNPKVLRNIYDPEHTWFGLQVPGSRASAGDNPDQIRTIIPIDGHSEYELFGKCFDKNIADVPFTVLGVCRADSA